MPKRKRLGDAAKPGNYDVNSAFCNTPSHDKHEEERLARERSQGEWLERARRDGRNLGLPKEPTKPAKKQAATMAPGGVPVSIGKDGKVFMSKAARRKLKKGAQRAQLDT
jgi:hypothetical protein